jgi:hypothetical protein
MVFAFLRERNGKALSTTILETPVRTKILVIVSLGLQAEWSA